MNPILRVQDLTKAFGGVIANRGINLDVSKGEIHAIIGPNGAGKTTLVAQLTGEVEPTSGCIEFDGQSVSGLPMHRRAALGMARCYQITSIFREYPAFDNVLISVMASSRNSSRWWKPALSDPDLGKPALELLEQVGLAGREHTIASDLSHGEQRQLELAMALATKPKLLLLDEPMAGMGPTESQRLIKLIGSFRGNVSILLIEHDMNAVFALAERISVLVGGEVIASGSPQSIASNSRVQDAYLSTQRSPRA